MRLELAEATRDLALFITAIDSKLRGCDLVKLKLADVFATGSVKERASIMQSKTKTPVRFELTEGTRAALKDWIGNPLMSGHDFLWPGRLRDRPHISTRQYARMLKDWVRSIGLEPSLWHAFDAADEGRPDLQENGQPARRAAPPGPYQDGQHRQIPRRRSGRRVGNFGRRGDLTEPGRLQSRPIADGRAEMACFPKVATHIRLCQERCEGSYADKVNTLINTSWSNCNRFDRFRSVSNCAIEKWLRDFTVFQFSDVLTNHPNRR